MYSMNRQEYAHGYNNRFTHEGDRNSNYYSDGPGWNRPYPVEHAGPHELHQNPRIPNPELVSTFRQPRRIPIEVVRHRDPRGPDCRQAPIYQDFRRNQQQGFQQGEIYTDPREAGYFDRVNRQQNLRISLRNSPPRDIRTERSQRRIRGRPTPIKTACYSASLVRNNKRIEYHKSRKSSIQIVTEVTKPIQKSCSNTSIVSMDLGTDEEEGKNSVAQDSNSNLQIGTSRKEIEDKNSAKYSIQKNDESNAATKESHQERCKNIDVEVVKCSRNKTIDTLSTADAINLSSDKHENLAAFHTEKKKIEKAPEPRTTGTSKIISNIPLPGNCIRKKNRITPTSVSTKLSSDKNVVRKSVATNPYNSTNNPKKGLSDSNKNLLNAKNSENNCDRKKVNWKIPIARANSSINKKRLSKSGKSISKNSINIIRNVEKSNLNHTSVVPSRDPRLRKVQGGHNRQGKVRYYRSFLKTTQGIDHQRIIDNTQVDPRTNHNGYKSLKVQPIDVIDLNVPHFSENSEELKRTKPEITSDLRNFRKPPRVMIKNRTSVCCENIVKIRKYYKKPFAELMKFCCHVSISRNDYKNILPKSPNISVSLIDTKKSYLPANDSAKKDPELNGLTLEQKDDAGKFWTLGDLVENQVAECEVPSVDISLIDTKRSYIVNTDLQKTTTQDITEQENGENEINPYKKRVHSDRNESRDLFIGVKNEMKPLNTRDFSDGNKGIVLVYGKNEIKPSNRKDLPHSKNDDDLPVIRKNEIKPTNRRDSSDGNKGDDLLVDRKNELKPPHRKELPHGKKADDLPVVRKNEIKITNRRDSSDGNKGDDLLVDRKNEMKPPNRRDLPHGKKSDDRLVERKVDTKLHRSAEIIDKNKLSNGDHKKTDTEDGIISSKRKHECNRNDGTPLYNVEEPVKKIIRRSSTSSDQKKRTHARNHDKVPPNGNKLEDKEKTKNSSKERDYPKMNKVLDTSSSKHQQSHRNPKVPLEKSAIKGTALKRDISDSSASITKKIKTDIHSEKVIPYEMHKAVTNDISNILNFPELEFNNKNQSDKTYGTESSDVETSLSVDAKMYMNTKASEKENYDKKVKGKSEILNPTSKPIMDEKILCTKQNDKAIVSDITFSTHVSEVPEINSETGSVMRSTELTKPTESKTSSTCSDNSNEEITVSYLIDGVEYSLHIPEGAKSSSTLDSDVSSDELLRSLEESIESMTSPDRSNSSTAENRTSQKDFSENKNLSTAKQVESSMEKNLIDESNSVQKLVLSDQVDENSQGLSNNSGKNSVAGKSENIGSPLDCGNSSMEAFTNDSQKDCSVKSNNNNGEEAHDIMEDEDGEELLLQVKVVENPNVKIEHDLDSLMDLRVDLFNIEPEIKLEDPETPKQPTSSVPASTVSSQLNIPNVKDPGTPKQPTSSVPASTVSSQLNKPNVTDQKQEENRSYKPSGNTLIKQLLETKSTYPSTRNPDSSGKVSQGNKITGDETNGLLEALIGQVIVDNFSRDKQDAHETGSQNNSSYGLLQSSNGLKCSQVGCSSPSQSQDMSRDTELPISNTNTIGATSHISNESCAAKNPSSKSALVTQQANISLKPTMFVPPITCSISDLTLPKLLGGSATTSSNTNINQCSDKTNSSAVDSRMGLSKTIPSLTRVNNSMTTEHQMPQMSSLFSGTSVDQGNDIVVMGSQFASNAFKIVNAYILSKCRGRYLAQSLDYLNKIRNLEKELNNVNDAMSKMREIFADILLENMRGLPMTMNNCIIFVSFFMEFLVGAMKNVKAKPFMSYYLWELLNVRNNEYEKTAALKYFKTYIENDLKAHKSLSGTPMAVEQYMMLKSQIFSYLYLLRCSKPSSREENNMGSATNVQNTKQYVTRQVIPNRSNYTQMGTNSSMESTTTVNMGNSKAAVSKNSKAQVISQQPSPTCVQNNLSQQQRVMGNTTSIIPTKQQHSSARIQNNSSSQQYEIMGNTTNIIPSTQQMPINVAGNRKRVAEVSGTTPSAQQLRLDASRNPPLSYNETWNIPKKIPNNATTYYSPNTSVSIPNLNQGVICKNPNCCTTEQSRTPVNAMSQVLYSTNLPITSSGMMTSNFNNLTFGGDINRHITPSGNCAPTTTSMITSFPNATFADSFYRSVMSSGACATMASSRGTTSNFQNIALNRNCMPQVTGVPVMTSRIIPNPTYRLANQMYTELNERLIPSANRNPMPNMAINTMPNQMNITNVPGNATMVNSRCENNQTTASAVQQRFHNQNYSGGPNVQVGSPTGGPSKSAFKTAANNMQNERNILEASNNGKQPPRTVVPIPSSILTPNTPENPLEASGNVKALSEPVGNMLPSSMTSPREPLPYPTPPISNENASSDNMERVQMTNLSVDWNSTSKITVTTPPTHVDQLEMKPLMGSSSPLKSIKCNPHHSVILKDEPEDVIDLTWLEDDEVKLEPSDDGFTLTLEEPEESLLILNNRKCVCGKDAIYLCACNTVMYCSQDCQFKDWENHQRVCPSGIIP